MTFFAFLGLAIAICAGITASFFRRGGIYNPLDPSESPVDSPVRPQEPVTATLPPEKDKVPPPLDFSSPRAAYHSTRVICDEMGLTVAEKNLICACIFQESNFNNKAVNRNKDATGKVLSTDWGICQVNDYWHIGKNKSFPSVEYVVLNPEKVVRWMIRCYKHGQLKMWVSYSSGAYKKWLLPLSPMWLLGAL